VNEKYLRALEALHSASIALQQAKSDYINALRYADEEKPKPRFDRTVQHDGQHNVDQRTWK
jgi:hypothetical protein